MGFNLFKRVAAVVLLCLFTFLASRLWTRVRWARNAQPTQTFSMNRDGPLCRVGWVEPPANGRLQCHEGERLRLKVRVSNDSPHLLASSLQERDFGRGVNLGYRIHNMENQLYREGERTLLHRPLYPKALTGIQSEREVTFIVQCPDEAGTYRLSVELVQEAVAWMSDITEPDRFAVATLDVDGGGASRREIFSAPNLSFAEASWHRAYHLARGLLQDSALTVDWQGRNVLVFEAGSQYPNVWVRDMASLQQAAHDLKITSSFWENHWSDLFLPDEGSGEVMDWVATGAAVDGKTKDKNDVQSDQELWLLRSIFEVVSLGHQPPAWLEEPKRYWGMQAALGWFLKHRWRQNPGCAFSGHVADWGDVGMEGTHPRSATKLENGHPFVCGIFVQALLYKVLETWRQFYREKPFPYEKSAADLQASIRRFVQDRLWQEKRGFFRIHSHLEPLEHDFDEGEIFALGGNLLASEVGLATPAQSASIARTILERQRRYGITTVGGVLLPPYPPGTFEYPPMSVQYQYQNGAQWDWFGAPAAGFLYRRDREIGGRAVDEIARKVLKSGSFHEWDHPDGTPGAGPRFRAGAAAFVSLLHQIARTKGVL